MSDELIRAARVARLEFPATDAAFQKVRQAIFEQWAGTPMSAVKEREHLYRHVQALDAARRAMIDVMGTGEDAIEAYKESIRRDAKGEQ